MGDNREVLDSEEATNTTGSTELDPVVENNRETYELESGVTGPAEGVVLEEEAIEETLELCKIYFKKDSDKLPPYEEAKVIELMAFLEDPYSKAIVVGHASTEGDPDYNMLLSRKRADSVISYLRKLGCSPGRIDGNALGDKEPDVAEEGIDGMAIEKNRALNRRVEVETIRRVPTSALGNWKRFAENALRGHRRAIPKLNERIAEFSGYAEQVRAKEHGGLYADWSFSVAFNKARMERFKRNLKALEEAILQGTDAVRDWDRQRGVERKDEHRYKRLRLRIIKDLLAEAQKELNQCEERQKEFWSDVIEGYAGIRELEEY